MSEKVKCWEVVKCTHTECPVYGKEVEQCWQFPGSPCREGRRELLQDEPESFLQCAVFRSNIDSSSIHDVLDAVHNQFVEYKRRVEERDRELEETSMELAIGLSEVFEALKKISAGDPDVRIPETSGLELLSKLKSMVNCTASNLAEIVELLHEFAIGLAEHFDVLCRVSKGELDARIQGDSQVELLECLKKVTNQMIESVAREMEQRRLAMDRCRQSQKRYRQLYEGSRDAYALVDMDGRILESNSTFREMLGYSDEELKNLTYEDITPEKWHDMESDILRWQLFERGYTDIYEKDYRRKNGEIFPVEIRTYLLRDDHGEHAGMWAFIRDITERKRMREERDRLEAQLRQTEKLRAIGTLAGGIAHNFNNLLTGILGNASLMLMSTPPDHPHHQRLKTIEALVKNGAGLTSQLLGYAREGKYEIKPIDLNRMVRETLETFALTRKDIRFHLDLCRDLHWIVADQGQIQQVLLNLLANGADAMPSGGDLHVTTKNVSSEEAPSDVDASESDACVTLSISDTGVGMAPEIRERIFEPFFTTKAPGCGTGLGMASVYGIVKAHKGAIEIDSAQGCGTTFSIHLPAARRKDLKASSTQGLETNGNREATVLLVDDEDLVADVGREMLSFAGYHVIVARSGKEATEIYRQKRDSIDLIILDMIMPDQSGEKTYEQLKAIDPDVKVLLASGYSVDGQAAEILEKGCDGFLQKPFVLDRMVREIRKILG